MTMIAINVVLPKTPTMMGMVVLDTRRSLTSGEGVGDEMDKEMDDEMDKEMGDEVDKEMGEEVDKEMGDEMDKEMNDEMDKEMGGEISSEVKVGFLHETPATSTCLTMSLPSFKERSSKEHSTSLSSDPVQATAERCIVLSGLP